MLFDIILPKIPLIYPNSINNKKSKLLPFVLLLVIDFITFNGHETPNKIIMPASRN